MAKPAIVNRMILVRFQVREQHKSMPHSLVKDAVLINRLGEFDSHMGYMTNDRSYEEDVTYWLGWENGEEPEEGLSPLLPHLSDQEILGLTDSYDDGRISTLAIAYIDLRKQINEAP